MIALLLSLASAQAPDDGIPLIDALPPPPIRTAEGCSLVAPYPEAEWPEALREGAAADALHAYLFPADVDRTSKERAGIRTDGILVLHKGEVVFESYAEPWSPDDRHLLWSASKTVASTLTGIAAHQGLLELDDSICEYVELDPASSCDITVAHLLQMASGLDWRETYEGVSPRASSVLAMLYGEGAQDMARFVGNHPRRDEPGKTWYYSSGDTNLLMGAVGKVLEEQAGERFPWQLLFGPIGMDATFERDGAGTYVGSSYVWSSPRDQARLGYLWLQDGCWAGERLLPQDWVSRATTPNDAIRQTARDRGNNSYGWLVWLNQPVTELGDTEPPWEGAPPDTYAMRGHWGQSITVIPSEDLVIVRSADDRDYSFDLGRMVALTLDLLAEDAP